MGTIIGDDIGATIGIIPPFPTKHQTAEPRPVEPQFLNLKGLGL